MILCHQLKHNEHSFFVPLCHPLHCLKILSISHNSYLHEQGSIEAAANGLFTCTLECNEALWCTVLTFCVVESAQVLILLALIYLRNKTLLFRPNCDHPWFCVSISSSFSTVPLSCSTIAIFFLLISPSCDPRWFLHLHFLFILNPPTLTIFTLG